MNRHQSYDEDLAKELKNSKFAAEFLLSLMEGKEGLNLIEALKHTIRRMGIKEFSHKARLHPKSVSRMLASTSFPKLETLDEYLKPFGLKSRLVTEKKVA